MSTIVSGTPRLVTASATPPAVKCPDWCVTSQEDHLAYLDDLEGMVSHDSGSEFGLSYSIRTYVDGTPGETPARIFREDFLPDLSMSPLIWPRVRESLDGATLEEAEDVAHRILATVKAAVAARAALGSPAA